jgi:EAL domain-containing protein (putative c-di-GMP-specific phosphodiesterase class I)/GGDEF domain-containing protein
MSNPQSHQQALLDALPDLVVLIRRDGTLIAYGGGQGLASLTPEPDAVGNHCETVWPQQVAQVIKRLAHGAIGRRSSTEASFQHLGQNYEARANAQGPDRALCIIRRVLAAAPEDTLESTGVRPAPRLDRRGFLRRFKDSMSLAALCEKPAAVAIIHVDGVTDIAQAFDSTIAEQIMSAAILRLSTPDGGSAGGSPAWYLGQLSDSVLALVLETSDRDSVDACVSSVCASLREPITVGTAEFHLTPYAGVAILGQDAASPKQLLSHARGAAAEARRSGSGSVSFFTDTLQLRSLARFDVARELHDAIANGEIRLRYVGRHDLASGRLVTWVGYLRWIHPVRGEVRPVEFLRVAEATGLAAALSRAALACLKADYTLLAPHWDADVGISFGALRHHILNDDFATDIAQFLADGAVPAQRLELRISEKTFIAHEPAACLGLQRLGVQLVVDEVARGMGSLDALARTQIWGLQLDRAWVTAVRNDEVALKVCRAGISVAAALGLTPIATGVDDQAQRQALLALGCRFGMGDLYQNAVPTVMKPYRAAVPA